MVISKRRNVKSFWVRALLLMVLFSMTLGGSLFVPGLLRQLSQAQRSVITVNGLGITPAHFIARMQHEHDRIEMFRNQFGPQADMFLKMLGMDNPQDTAYKSLVAEAVVTAEAQRIGLSVDENYIIQQLHNPSFVVQQLTDIVPMYVLERDGSINNEALKRYLQHIHLSMADFEKLVEDAFQRSTFLDLIKSTAYNSTHELKNRFIQQYVPKNYTVLPFVLDTYIQKVKKLTPTAEEVATFFEQENRTSQRYWTPEKRSGIVWEFSPEEFGISIPEKDVETYYKKHKQDYVQSAPKIRIRRILLKVDDQQTENDAYKKIQELHADLVKNPALFVEYAQRYSQDRTASQSGPLPWYTKEELKPSIASAAFRLSSDGAISSVLHTDEGYEIIQRVERKAKEFKPLALVQSDIEKTLRNKRFAKKFDALMKQESAKEKVLEALYDLKKNYNAHEKILNLVGRDESRTHTELFALKVHKMAYYVEDGKGYVIFLQSITPSQKSALSEVKKRVEDDWRHQKAQALFHDDLKAAESSVREKGMEATAKQFGLTLERLDGLSLDAKKSSETWAQKGYPVSDIMALRFVGERKTIQKGTAAYIVEFTREGAFQDELFQQKKAEIARELYQETAERLQRGFVASLQRHATIKTSEDFNTIRNAH